MVVVVVVGGMVVVVVSRRVGIPGQHTGRQEGLWRGRGRRQSQAAREDEMHVFTRALEHFDVALLLAEDHVVVVALVSRLE